jgi:signal transduction histidine kinase
VQGKASYPEQEQKKLVKAIEKAIEGTPFADVFRFITSKDEIKFVRVTGKPLFNQENEVVALRGSIQDITSDHLRHATTKEALASVKTAVLEWFPLKEEISADKNWNLLLEIKETTPRENYRLWLEAIHPEDREEWLQRSKVALNDLPNFDINLRIVTHGGDVKDLQGHFKIYRNQHGGPRRVVGTLTDVSRLRHTETELKEQYRIMAQTSKMAQLGEITAGLGHEINNPLAIAIGNHRLIQKLIEKADLSNDFKSPLEKALVDQIEALERIRRLVKNFKSFSHSKGHEKQVFDISETIRETCELFKVLLNRNSIHLTLELESGLTCQGNRERFN